MSPRAKQDWSPRDPARRSGPWQPRRWPAGTATTKVIFRAWPDGEVVALFPELSEGPGLCSSYMHVGQHGAASCRLIDDTRPAKPEEYSALAWELEAIGYRLVPIKRFTRSLRSGLGGAGGEPDFERQD